VIVLVSVMELDALQIFVGEDWIWPNPFEQRRVKITKSCLSFEVENSHSEELKSIVIPKKDVTKIKHPRSQSTIQVLYLYLKQKAYSKIFADVVLQNIPDKPCDSQGRVMIIFNVEYQHVSTQPSMIVRFLSQHFTKTSLVPLDVKDCTSLLKKSCNDSTAVIFHFEAMWCEEDKFALLSPNDEYESRKFSSYTYIGLPNTKKEFLSQLESWDTPAKLYCFLQVMLWYPSMIMDECADFIAEHQCAKPGCEKFSPMKCGNCKVARYCDQKCQEDDSDLHAKICTKLKKIRKDDVEAQVAKKLETIVAEEICPGKKRKDFVSYQFFVSKMRTRIFEHYAEPLLVNDRQQFYKKLRERNVTISDSLSENISNLRSSIC